jgi:hypothetical protein
MTMWSHFLLISTFTDTGPLGRHEGTAMCDEQRGKPERAATRWGQDGHAGAMMQVDNTAMVSATPAMEIWRSHCSFGQIAVARGLPLFLEHCRTLPPNMSQLPRPRWPGRDSELRVCRCHLITGAGIQRKPRDGTPHLGPSTRRLKYQSSDSSVTMS